MMDYVAAEKDHFVWKMFFLYAVSSLVEMDVKVAC